MKNALENFFRTNRNAGLALLSFRENSFMVAPRELAEITTKIEFVDRYDQDKEYGDSEIWTVFSFEDPDNGEKCYIKFVGYHDSYGNDLRYEASYFVTATPVQKFEFTKEHAIY